MHFKRTFFLSTVTFVILATNPAVYGIEPLPNAISNENVDRSPLQNAQKDNDTMDWTSPHNAEAEMITTPGNDNVDWMTPLNAEGKDNADRTPSLDAEGNDNVDRTLPLDAESNDNMDWTTPLNAEATTPESFVSQIKKNLPLPEDLSDKIIDASVVHVCPQLPQRPVYGQLDRRNQDIKRKLFGDLNQ